MTTKTISESSYRWGHFAAIMIDFIIFIIIAYLAFVIKIRISSSNKSVRRKSNEKYINFRLNIIFWLSLIIGFVTLFGLIPIFTDYDEITIS